MILEAQKIETFEAAGKLMLFGEYIVLHGSKSLAFPLKFGQTLSVEPADQCSWTSYAQGEEWFSASFTKNLDVAKTNNDEVAEILKGILKTIHALRPELDLTRSFKAEANFNLKWGLGSSSTLISLLSQWSGVDAQELLKTSFGGSGYDVACATADSPIIYTKGEEVTNVSLSKEVTDHMLFVYLGNKQNSRAEIKRFEGSPIGTNEVKEMNTIIEQGLASTDIETFEQVLDRSEAFLSPLIGKQQLKTVFFDDYPYSIKSLGAWGGDFFLATYRDLDEAKTYFNNKGLNTSFTYDELIK